MQQQQQQQRKKNSETRLPDGRSVAQRGFQSVKKVIFPTKHDQPFIGRASRTCVKHSQNFARFLALAPYLYMFEA